MPWNNGGPGGSDGPPNPWGVPPGGPGGRNGSGERPRGPEGRGAGQRGPWGGTSSPEIDELIGRAQAWVRRLQPPSFGGGPRRGRRFSGGRGAVLLLVAAAALWLASGFYRVQPDELGVVTRFGAYVRSSFPGLNYHLPWPIEGVETPAVTRINRVEVGSDTNGQDVLQESLMLTGDENIIDIDFAVFWRIRDPVKYLFSTRDPDHTVSQVAESVMREVIGSTPIQPALTTARASIEQKVLAGEQAVLDKYGTGVEITQVQLQKVDPPADVIESFRDVQRANTDAERARNEAESYRNDIVPRARGDAANVTANADAQRQAAIAQANGESQRFLSVLKAYDAARGVTLERLYIETMQDVLSHTPATVVDDTLKGIVPFLPLGQPATPPLPGAAK